MNERRDPNKSTGPSAIPADSVPEDPISTTDHVPGSAGTDGSHPAAAPPRDLPAVPGYRVQREISRGGMGRVLAAYDLSLGRDVALKILLPGANADRFVRESKITARLPHPGIPPVYALGTLADGSPFLAMKLIAGQTLAEEMKTADRPRMLQAFIQVCQAVGFAHSRGIIHRDLKPANVMVGAFGEVQVMDWGLAKDLTNREVEDAPGSSEALTVPSAGVDPSQTTDYGGPGESTNDRTRAGQVMGTPAYMAPEQARGEATDARADVFALAGILCAILTGRPPFGGKPAQDAIRRAGAADLVEAFARLDGCGADAELVAMCRRSLSPRPEDRPADGRALADGLTAYLNGVQGRLQAAERERAVAVAREAEQGKRRRVQLALTAAVMLLLLGGGAFAWWQDRQTSERRAEARDKERQASQGVDAALKLVPDLRKQYKFGAAKQTLDQAALLAKGGAPDRLAEVEQAQRDLAFVVQLDEIRYRKWIWIAEADKGKFKLEIAAPEYRQAFAGHDLDLTALGPAEAAERIAASAVKADLVAAVDDWALHEPEPGLRDRLLDAARQADPGPWTDRLRDPAVQTDRDALGKLAEDPGAAGTSAATLSVLATLMWRAGLDPSPMLTAARTAYPGEFELAFALGLWHIKTGRDDQQIGAFEAARALRPENVAAWINLGNPRRVTGQVDEAIACYRKAIALDPKLTTAHLNLGFALAAKGEADEAIACYRQALALDPKLASAHNGLGDALSRKGQVDKAIASYHKAIALASKLTTAHYNLGNSLSRKGQVDEAIACFREAVALDPKFAMAHNNLGVALLRKGQADEAFACFRKAVATDPKLATAHYSLGLALAGKGQVDEAVACYREAIRLQPDFAEAHCNLGGLLRSRGDFAGAAEMYRKGHELGSRRTDWRYPSAQWLAQAEHELALSRRLPALLRGEDKPKDGAELLAFARVATSQKQFAAAARLVAEALESDPKLGEDRQAGYRYDAACAASLAAAGFGQGEPLPDDAAKAKLRRQALDWLKTELAVWAKHLESDPPEARPLIVQTLSHWWKDTDLAGIREKAALAKLPAEEQKAFTQLWADVAALLKKAETPAQKEGK